MLPAGYTTRPPRLEDAEAIYQLTAAYNTKVVGGPDGTLAEVVEGLTLSTFQPEQDGWLVLDGSGRPVNYAHLRVGGSGRHARVSVASADSPGAAWLLAAGVRRAHELLGPGGVVEVGMHRANEVLRDLVRSAGFTLDTTWYRMRIDHSGPVAVPEPPAGTALRGAYDETTRRAIHAVMTEAFTGQESAAVRPYDDWVDTHEKRSTADWSQVSLVELEGRPVAASDCSHAFVETYNCGYIGRLGVIPEARGRGLAKYLLRHAFATDAAAGLDGTLLHVDTSNPTQALGLYESVGMRVVQTAELWALETQPRPRTGVRGGAAE